MDSVERLTSAEAGLPETLEYIGEFGSELIVFLPFVTWLSQQGLLRRHRVTSYSGMRSFYAHLDCREYVEKSEPRRYVKPAARPAWLPIKDEDSFDGTRARCERHVYPDLRARFAQVDLHAVSLRSGKPLLIVHNKYNNEWAFKRPINHLNCDILAEIFTRLQNNYTIVYIRHGMRPVDASYSHDHNITRKGLGDAQLLAHFPGILTFEQVFEEHVAAGGARDVNQFKNALYARCFHFISAQGGGTYQCAYFSGALLLILHRTGIEHRWPYHGYFRWLATPPVRLAIATSDAELREGLALFQATAIAGGVALLPSAAAPVAAALDPARHGLVSMPPWKVVQDQPHLLSDAAGEGLPAPALGRAATPPKPAPEAPAPAPTASFSLHLGVHKTATTYLQGRLANSAAYLASRKVSFEPLEPFRDTFTTPLWSTPPEDPQGAVAGGAEGGVPGIPRPLARAFRGLGREPARLLQPKWPHLRRRARAAAPARRLPAGRAAQRRPHRAGLCGLDPVLLHRVHPLAALCRIPGVSEPAAAR
ncbi:hypothetical protein [Falsiroseomonas sp.]|uniref:hypothetical protein n=1 Tax=Falsiroseomonas sp. TaxID=2870721 RepID=UPI003565A962